MTDSDMIAVRFRQARSALAAAHRMQRDVFPVALALCGAPDPERFSSVQIVEVFLAPGRHKLSTRTSLLSDRQWSKVVERSIAVLGTNGSGLPVSVTLIAGEPFDDRAGAADLPPGFPKSSLKGIAPGPVRITTMMTSRDGPAVLSIDFAPVASDDVTIDEQLPLATSALRAIEQEPEFELAAVGSRDMDYEGAFNLVAMDESVLLVRGPGCSPQRWADLAASASRTQADLGPLPALRFDPA